MRDLQFRRAYEALELEFGIIREIIDLQVKRGMTHGQLEKKVRAKQPSIARMERRGKTRDLDYLQRVANALDAKLEVRLVPRKASCKGNGPRTKFVSMALCAIEIPSRCVNVKGRVQRVVGTSTSSSTSMESGPCNPQTRFDSQSKSVFGFRDSLLPVESRAPNSMRR